MGRSRLLILPPVKVTREHHQSVLAVQIEYLSTADICSDVTALLELPHSLLDRSLGGGGEGSSFKYCMCSNCIVIMTRYLYCLPSAKGLHRSTSESGLQMGD